MECEQTTCDFCANDTAATSICLDCSHDLCEDHAASHIKKRKYATHHVVLASRRDESSEVASVAAATAGFSSGSVRSRLCPVHLTQHVTHYCRQCDDVACSLCLKLSAHTEHSEVLTSIQEAGKESREKMQKQCSESIHGNCRASITQKLEALEATTNGIKDQAAELSKQVTEEIARKIELLKLQEAKLLDDIDQLQWQKCLPIEKHRSALSECVTALDRLQSIAVSCDGDYDAVRVAPWVMRKAEEIASTATEDVTDVSSRCEILCINLTDHVTGEDISNIGSVCDAGEVDLPASKVCSPETAIAGQQFPVSVILADGSKADIASLYQRVSIDLAGPEDLDAAAAPISPCGHSEPASAATSAELTRPGVWQCQVETPGVYTVTAKFDEFNLGQRKRLSVLPAIRFDQQKCEPSLQLTANHTVLKCPERTGKQRSGYSTLFQAGIHRVRLVFRSDLAKVEKGQFPLCGIVADSDSNILVGGVGSLRGVGSSGLLIGSGCATGAEARAWKNEVEFTMVIDFNARVFTMQCRQAGESWEYRWTGIPEKVRIQAGLHYANTSFTLLPA